MTDKIRKTLDKNLINDELLTAVIGVLASNKKMRAEFFKNPSDFLKEHDINPEQVNIEALCIAINDVGKKITRTMIQNFNKEFIPFPNIFVKPKIKPIVPRIKPIVPKIKPIVKPIVPRIKPIVPRIKPIVPKVKPIVPEIKPIVPKIKPYMPCLEIKITDIRKIKILEDLKPLISKEVLKKISKSSSR